MKKFNKLAVAAVGFLVCTAAPAATAEESSAQSNSNENQAEVQFTTPLETLTRMVSVCLHGLQEAALGHLAVLVRELLLESKAAA